MTNWIVINAIQTPDGTILKSRHRHDYKTHIDKKTGKEYMVDGGLDYLRRNSHDDYIELSKYYNDLTHEEIIDILEWGANYDKNMNRLSKTKFIKIKDMETSHIEAILVGGYCNSEMYLNAFKNELKNRNEKSK